jgi:hypothetical protein
MEKELSRLLSVEGQPTKVVLAQTCMGVFFIPSMFDTIFEMLFLFKTACGTPPTTWRTAADHSFINTVLIY